MIAKHLSILGIFVSLGSLHASVSFSIQADRLADNFGQSIPQNSLVLFLADINNTGFNIVPGSFSVGGYLGNSPENNMILGAYDLSSTGMDGVLLEATPALELVGGWTSGDPLAIVWFPDLTLEATSLSAGDFYGIYSGPASDGSDPWVTPSDGSSLHRLYFFTTDSRDLPNGPDSGSVSPEAAQANLQVVPEPSVYAALLGGLALLVALRRRRTV